LAVKDIMIKNHMKGTIKIWPGIAEELLGAKAYYVRAGYFKDVDAVLFAHVANNLGVGYGGFTTLGAVSVRFDFVGESSHAAVAPWKGRSALSAAELMDVGWSFKRQFLRPVQRSHNVIVNGGDQPNVVPSNASNWYYFREATAPTVRELWATGEKMAEGASLMSSTTYSSTVLGSAWPGWFNKPIAEAEYANIKQVGLPTWSRFEGAAQNRASLAVRQTISAMFPGMFPPSFLLIPRTFPTYLAITGLTASPWLLRSLIKAW
jgi:aminobenzoyl-glutamate utilization protein B